MTPTYIDAPASSYRMGAVPSAGLREVIEY